MPDSPVQSSPSQINLAPVSGTTPQPEKPSYHPHIIGFVTLIIIFGLGYFFGTRKVNYSEPIPSPQAIASPVSSPDLTVNWKVYQNTEFGFSFKYPEDLEVGKDYPIGFQPINILSYQKYHVININVWKNYNNTTGKPYEDLKSYINDLRASEITATELIIDGNPAKKIVSQGDPGHAPPSQEMFVFSKNKQFILNLYIEPFSYSQHQNDTWLFDQILSTFKFADENKVDTSNWKTYTDSKLNFSFKYPDYLSEAGIVGGTFTGDPQYISTLGDKSTMREGTDAPYDGFSFYSVSNPNDSIDAYLTKELSAREQSPRGTFSKKIIKTVIAGKPSAYLDIEQAIRQYFIPTKDNTILVFSVVRQSDDFLSVFDQILSTFKFTE